MTTTFCMVLVDRDLAITVENIVLVVWRANTWMDVGGIIGDKESTD